MNFFTLWVTLLTYLGLWHSKNVIVKTDFLVAPWFQYTAPDKVRFLKPPSVDLVLKYNATEIINSLPTPYMALSAEIDELWLYVIEYARLSTAAKLCNDTVNTTPMVYTNDILQSMAQGVFTYNNHGKSVLMSWMEPLQLKVANCNTSNLWIRSSLAKEMLNGPQFKQLLVRSNNGGRIRHSGPQWGMFYHYGDAQPPKHCNKYDKLKYTRSRMKLLPMTFSGGHCYSNGSIEPGTWSVVRT
jgi:hypothetical protein